MQEPGQPLSAIAANSIHQLQSQTNYMMQLTIYMFSMQGCDVWWWSVDGSGGQWVVDSSAIWHLGGIFTRDSSSV